MIGNEPEDGADFTYDVSTGLVKSQIDLDNQTSTTFGYDLLGRRTSMNEAGLRETTTLYDEANRKVTTKADVAQFNDQGLTTITSYDGLGRSRLVQTTDDDGAALTTRRKESR